MSAMIARTRFDFMLSSVGGKDSSLTAAHGTRNCALVPSAYGFFRKPHLRAVFFERVQLELRSRDDAAADPALRAGAGLHRSRDRQPHRAPHRLADDLQLDRRSMDRPPR